MFKPFILRNWRATLAGAVALAAAATHASCATSVADLRGLLQDRFFPLHWEETSMSDARPLLVAIEDRAGALFISFVKTGEGLLAEGPARVCPIDDRLEAHFQADGLQLGPAASLVLKTALRAGVAVGLQRAGARRLRIGTVGWTGDFVPGTSGVGLKTNYAGS